LNNTKYCIYSIALRGATDVMQADSPSSHPPGPRAGKANAMFPYENSCKI